MNIKINVLNKNVKIPEEIITATGGDELLARIFFNRGYKDPATIRQMLDDTLYESTSTAEFPNIDKAVQRMVKALELNETIAVYGDYDVDGVTSTVTLVQCLKLFTSNVIYHVPDRFSEGYGMNEGVIHTLANQSVSLVITCDCGISNINEITLAKSLGMDVIITDHHNLPDELPPADIILNPKLLGEGHRAKNISGCAMAYFLCIALLQHYKQGEKAVDFLDLLALSLVADVVSLNGENRSLLKKALPKLYNTDRVGLQELFAIIERDSKLQNEEDIGFQIAPRINAAGRMESARLPVELLLSDEPQIARDMALKIDFLNKERKRLQQDIVREAQEIVENKKKNKPILVLFNEYWHHGIIGIAAGKICETYRKPTILLSMKEDGSTVVGSARSVDDIDIYSLLRQCSGRLLKFGGHAAAAGLSLKKDDIEAFTGEIELLADKMYYIKDTVKVDVDMELGLEKVDEDIYSTLLKAGPYGEGFEAPIFATWGVSVLSDRRTDKGHHIMVLAGENNVRMPAVKWFGGDIDLQGRVFDITYKITRNTYRGNNQLQLTIDHIVETDGKLKTAFEGNIIDSRKESIHSILKKYEDVLVFYEGLSSACPVKEVVDRDRVEKTKTLVFLSTPLNTPVFREVISLANPENVIINFSAVPDYTFKGFVMNIMSLVKYFINNNGGRTQLESIALKLCVEVNVVKAALKYLKALGKLEYSISDDNEVLLLRSDKQADKTLHMAEKNLRNALEEKKAYQDFILKLEVEMFKEYLK